MRSSLTLCALISCALLGLSPALAQAPTRAPAEAPRAAEAPREVVMIDGEAYEPDPEQARSATLTCRKYSKLQKKWVKCSPCRNGLCLVRIRKRRVGSGIKVAPQEE